jgi:hypothetical protein
METAQTANPPTPDEIWAILREVGRKQEETARQMEEYNKRMGHVDNLFGEITEYMVAPKLCEKFREFGLDFPRVNPNGVYVNDRDNRIFLEIDLMLENGDKAMLIEAKAKVTTERVKKHIERLEKMRTYADLHGDKRTFLGAVAGIVATDEVKKFILEQGLYLIEPSGDNFNITPPNGIPKEW